MKKLPNLLKFDEISDGDKDFKDLMIGIFKKEFPIEKKAFFDSFDSGKYKESAEVVHKLKHKINLLNLEEGYMLASNFESQLIDNSFELFDEFVIILETIENFLKKI